MRVCNELYMVNHMNSLNGKCVLVFVWQLSFSRENQAAARARGNSYADGTRQSASPLSINQGETKLFVLSN